MPLKIGGQVVSGANTGLIVIPRESGDIVFKFVAILDDSDYLRVNPEPKPPREYITKEQKHVEKVNDPKYKAKHEKWRGDKWDWMFLKSVEPSMIEWETVKLDDPATWGNWKQELRDAGLSVGEIGQIENTFFETNIVTDAKLKEAKNRFLASQAQAMLETSSSTDTESLNTSLGEFVNAGESAHQE
jgi:hypothetical protein